MSASPTAFAARKQPWLPVGPAEGSSDTGLRPQLSQCEFELSWGDDWPGLKLAPELLQSQQAEPVEVVRAHRLVRGIADAQRPQRLVTAVDVAHRLPHRHPPLPGEPAQDEQLALLLFQNQRSHSPSDVRVQNLQTDPGFARADDLEEADPTHEILVETLDERPHRIAPVSRGQLDNLPPDPLD